MSNPYSVQLFFGLKADYSNMYLIKISLKHDLSSWNFFIQLLKSKNVQNQYTFTESRKTTEYGLVVDKLGRSLSLAPGDQNSTSKNNR